MDQTFRSGNAARKSGDEKTDRNARAGKDYKRGIRGQLSMERRANRGLPRAGRGHEFLRHSAGWDEYDPTGVGDSCALRMPGLPYGCGRARVEFQYARTESGDEYERFSGESIGATQ